MKWHRLLFRHPKFVQTDNDALRRLDGALKVKCGVLNLTLNPSAFNRSQHSAQLINLRQILESIALNLVRQRFNRKGAANRIYSIGHTGLVSNDLLSA